MDSGGGRYSVRGARINNYLVQPGGSEISQLRSRLRVRYVEFEDLACGN